MGNIEETTSRTFPAFTEELTHRIIRLALEEDRVENDITTNSLLDCDNTVIAHVTAKEAGVISGAGVFTAVFNTVDPTVRVTVVKTDGSAVAAGDLVLEIQGKESSILKAERTALNFLQRLSGIATLTRRYVEKLSPFAVTLLDTRKTTPGMRYLEKKAVTDGGGQNHRLNLEDMAMVKDNHIKMAGSIADAVGRIKAGFPDKPIEVEVRTLEELDEALALGKNVDVVMLDNFSPHLLREAVRRNRDSASPVKLEISGNVNLDNIAGKAAAADGIDALFGQYKCGGGTGDTAADHQYIGFGKFVFHSIQSY